MDYAYRFAFGRHFARLKGETLCRAGATTKSKGCCLAVVPKNRSGSPPAKSRRCSHSLAVARGLSVVPTVKLSQQVASCLLTRNFRCSGSRTLSGSSTTGAVHADAVLWASCRVWQTWLCRTVLVESSSHWTGLCLQMQTPAPLICNTPLRL